MDNHNKDLEYFHAKFEELSQDAREHGILPIVLLSAEDPIGRQVVFAEVFRGSYIQKIGMLQEAVWRTQRRTLTSG